tara:strand:+ start:169 stop:561 length:393 start_codon:yes stop_codon:yes gene_type:complete
LYSTIELTDLKLNTDIGTYGADDVIPSAHSLDLTLSIDPALVLIEKEGMAHIFDYDPLIAEVDRLARDQHYETQEGLITRIVAACATQPQINAVEVCLRKTPVIGDSGTLGVRLVVGAGQLAQLRKQVCR